MVRKHSQRAHAAMLLRLPSDMLLKIASHVVAPGLVVAAGKNLEARTALRKGTDAAERSRFGGTIGLTVREAEHRLRTEYSGVLENNDLVSRNAAGLALIMKTTWDDDESFGIYEEVAKTLIAYGADVNVQENSGRDVGYILLHVACNADDPVAFARMLLAAGANIDARATPPNAAGLSPLAWSIDCGRGTERSYALASFLIEQGCDVVEAEADYYYQSHGRSLLEVLESRASTEGNLRLADQIYDALEAAGEPRCDAALRAAYRRPRFDSLSDSESDDSDSDDSDSGSD
jgi:hypothetical protein